MPWRLVEDVQRPPELDNRFRLLGVGRPGLMFPPMTPTLTTATTECVALPRTVLQCLLQPVWMPQPKLVARK